MQFHRLIFQSIVWKGLHYFMVLLNILVARYFKATGAGSVYHISNYFSFILLLGSGLLKTGITSYGSQESISCRRLAVFSLVWSNLASAIILFLTGRISSRQLSQKGILYFLINLYPGPPIQYLFLRLFWTKQDFIIPNLEMSVNNLLLIELLITIKRAIAEYCRTYGW